MRVRTGRRLRLVACLAGIIGGFGQAMLAIAIYGRTKSNIDAYIAGVMATVNFAVSLVLLGHHSVHVYTPIKSSIVSLFLTGILANLLGVAGLLLNENANASADTTNHLFFITTHKQDYAFAILFYISVCLSCLFASGLATYFLYDVLYATPEKEPNLEVTCADPEAPSIFTSTKMSAMSPSKRDWCNRLTSKTTIGPNRRKIVGYRVNSSASDVSHHDGNSFCSAQSEQSEDFGSEGSTDGTLVDEQQKRSDQQNKALHAERQSTHSVRVGHAPDNRCTSPKTGKTSTPRPDSVGLSQAMSVSPSTSNDHIVEIPESGSKKSIRSHRISKDLHVGSNKETEKVLGEPRHTSTPNRFRRSPAANITVATLSSPAPPLPPPPPPPLPSLPAPEKPHRYRDVVADEGRSEKKHIHFQEVPGTSSLPSIHKPKADCQNPQIVASNSTSFIGLPNSLFDQVRSFDKTKFKRAKRRPSLAVDQSIRRSTTSADATTANTATQTVLTSKSQYSTNHL